MSTNLLGQTKTVKDKYDPQKSTTYEYWLLPGCGAQWVRQGRVKH